MAPGGALETKYEGLHRPKVFIQTSVFLCAHYNEWYVRDKYILRTFHVHEMDITRISRNSQYAHFMYINANVHIMHIKCTRYVMHIKGTYATSTFYAHFMCIP